MSDSGTKLHPRVDIIWLRSTLTTYRCRALTKPVFVGSLVVLRSQFLLAPWRGIISADYQYLDREPEPDRKQQASDPSWRALRGRGGNWGYKQKLRHISEGLIEGHYSNRYPWALQTGPTIRYDYAKRWSFRVNPNVLWEIGKLSRYIFRVFN